MTAESPDGIVIAGASLAGLRVASVLRAEGYSGKLTIIGAEEDTYDRPPLSKDFLIRDLAAADISLRGREVEADWMLGVKATGLDLSAQYVRTDQRGDVPYEALVIATGSTPRALRNFPVDNSTVFQLRNLADARALREALKRRGRVAIIGAGFIGVELASTARTLGCTVDLVAPEPPLARLGSAISDFAKDLCCRNGVTMHLNRMALSMAHNDDIVDIVLDDGTTLKVETVVVAVGADPEVSWLHGTGLAHVGGVTCDAYGYVAGLSNVFAAGDVAAWPGPDGVVHRVEHWSNAIEQGTIVARQLIHGRGDLRPSTRIPSVWSDHFGTRMQAIGYPHLADETEIVEGSIEDGRFAAAMYRDGDLVAAVGYGVPAVIAKCRMELSGRFALAKPT